MSDAPRSTPNYLAIVSLALGVLAVVNALWPAAPMAVLLGLAALIAGIGVMATAEAQSNVRTMAIVGVCAGLIGVGAALLIKPAATGARPHESDPSAAVDPEVIKQAVRDAFDGIRAEQESSPAMAEARKKAMQVRCSANMRQISQSLMMYSQDNNDRMPSDLMLLERMGMIRAKQFQSPLDSDESNVCDYYYVPYQRYRSGSKNWLLLWTDPAYTNGDGANVVYTDGQAEYLKADEFKRVMDRFVREYKQANSGNAPPVVKPH
ncbi:MAG: DUF308 domain-containing protein [Phycisphaerae bacterium]|nr:DUF308 domain-containing protein [Phycisphaerae bacterium]